MRGVRIACAIGVAALLVGAAAHELGGSGEEAPARLAPAAVADPRLVLVSGRDDHGMVASDLVSLYADQDGGRVVSRVHDATLAEVLAVDGQWLEVRAVEGPSAIGWVQDYYLRGEVRLVGPAPSCRTSIDGRRRDGGTLVVVRELRRDRVRVETVTPPLVRGWAPRADLQELPPQGTACGAIPPDDAHAHLHR